MAEEEEEEVVTTFSSGGESSTGGAGIQGYYVKDVVMVNGADALIQQCD